MKKVNFWVIGTSQQLEKLENISIRIGESTIYPTEFARNLGYFMDKHMKNGYHINKITGTSYHLLRNIRTIRPYLNQETTKNHHSCTGNVETGLLQLAFRWDSRLPTQQASNYPKHGLQNSLQSTEI